METLKGKKRIVCEPVWILSAFLIIWAGMAMYSIPKVEAPSLLPDEFGYWAHAASMTGRDWGEVASQFSWYSFGYGILMAPFMAYIRDPILLYRTMVSLNFLLLGLMAVLIFRIMSSLLPEENKGILAFTAGAMLSYPFCLSYAQLTMAEALLLFLFALLALCLLRWFQKPSLLRGAAVFLIAGYMYIVHMRTVGILFAAVLCMGAAGFCRTKRKRVLSVAGILLAAALFICLGHFGKEFLSGRESVTEAYRELLQGNYYGAQWAKFRALFSLRGIWRFIVSLGGKVFYLGCASFGLYFWGMGFLLVQAKRLAGGIRKRTGITAAQWFFLWLLLAHVAALLISTVYCMETDRLDGLLYGRYHENTVLLIFALGFLELLRSPALKKRLLWLCGLMCGCFFLVFGLLESGEIRYLNLHSVLGIFYAIVLAGHYGRRTILYAYVCGMAGSAILLGAGQLAKKSGRSFLLMIAVTLLWTPVSIMASQGTVLAAGSANHSSIQMLEQLREKTEEMQIGEVWFLTGEENQSSCIVQYMLPDLLVHPVTVQEIIEQGEDGRIIIFQTGNMAAEEWSRGKLPFMRSALYKVYYLE